MSKPIKLENLSLSFPHKICFENFSTLIHSGSKIAVIGNNGSGKTTLLKAIAGYETPLFGNIYIPPEIKVSYVPQTITEHSNLSGGQRFNKELSRALSENPDLLLLDEPTNHLDIYNRKSLMGMLTRFNGTLIVVSHDEELLNKNAGILWHIDGGKIKIFNGKYCDYKTNAVLTKNSLEEEKRILEREKNSAHKKLMKQQERASKSRKGGEKKREEAKWAPVAAGIKKSGAEVSAGKQKSEISQRRNDINERLKSLKISEEITPSFYLNSASVSFNLSVSGGSAGYENNEVLTDINIAISAGQKTALIGRNASGKTTLLRALSGDQNVLKNGVWIVPKKENIGYLDQHYSNLDYNTTIIDFISAIVPKWTHAEIRKHLNDFLFRKNEEVNEKISLLSGGEKARLSLAAISCRVPQLLILDEITNNIDLITKEHIAKILSLYPGSLLLVSHEPEFIKKIGINDIYVAENNQIKLDSLCKFTD
ncbi:MAG: ABC-F family ATP-binding cassette domain-containing protein [Endomicrobiaceae bacterium]|nr:ABC-F family ATP-binding cassette domain-containing protein [Endomicrobiaceae bacterium]